MAIYHSILVSDNSFPLILMKLVTRDQGHTRPIGTMVDRFFSDPFNWEFPAFRDVQAFLPAMDVSETEKEVIIEANVPGFDPADVKVETHNGVLTINGTHQSNQEQHDKTYYHRERRSSSFSRQVSLPDYADAAKAACKIKNGTLTIRIPKKAEAERKSLSIEVEG